MGKVLVLLEIICVIMAIIILVFFKSVQFAWLFGLLYLVFHRLDKQITKLSGVIEPGKWKKFLNILKVSFGLNKFWTWGFIFISGLWLIIYVI